MTQQDSDALTGLLDRIQYLEDVHEISQLRARYCQALDDARWDDLTDTFIPEGRFNGLSLVEGHEQMLEFFPGLQQTVSSWWHFSSNETVEIDGDRATGTTWLLQPCVIDGESHLAAGRYEDQMVRTQSGWKFHERKVRFFFWSSLEAGWDAARFSWPPSAEAADPRTLSLHKNGAEQST